MAISFVNGNYGFSAAHSTITVQYPAGLATNDLLFLFAVKWHEGGSFNTPTGWNLLIQEICNSGDPITSAVFWRLHDGVATSALLEYPADAGSGISGSVVGFRGSFTPGYIFNATPTSAHGANSDTPTNPPITTVNDNSCVLLYNAQGSEKWDNATQGEPAGYTLAVKGISAGQQAGAFLLDAGLAGTVTPGAWTHTSGGGPPPEYSVYTIAFSEAGPQTIDESTTFTTNAVLSDTPSVLSTRSATIGASSSLSGSQYKLFIDSETFGLTGNLAESNQQTFELTESLAASNVLGVVDTAIFLNTGTFASTLTMSAVSGLAFFNDVSVGGVNGLSTADRMDFNPSVSLGSVLALSESSLWEHNHFVNYSLSSGFVGIGSETYEGSGTLSSTSSIASTVSGVNSAGGNKTWEEMAWLTWEATTFVWNSTFFDHHGGFSERSGYTGILPIIEVDVSFNGGSSFASVGLFDFNTDTAFNLSTVFSADSFNTIPESVIIPSFSGAVESHSVIFNPEVSFDFVSSVVMSSGDIYLHEVFLTGVSGLLTVNLATLEEVTSFSSITSFTSVSTAVWDNPIAMANLSGLVGASNKSMLESIVFQKLSSIGAFEDAIFQKSVAVALIADFISVNGLAYSADVSIDSITSFISGYDYIMGEVLSFGGSASLSALNVGSFGQEVFLTSWLSANVGDQMSMAQPVSVGGVSTMYGYSPTWGKEKVSTVSSWTSGEISVSSNWYDGENQPIINDWLDSE